MTRHAADTLLVGLQYQTRQVQELAALLEDVDLEDADVYLPLRSELDWPAQLEARLEAEANAQEEGGWYEN